MHETHRSVVRLHAVSDDARHRSIPLYSEMQRMLTELAADFARPNSNVYELGCATGTALPALHRGVAGSVQFIAADNSEEMLTHCRERLAPVSRERRVEYVRADLNCGMTLRNASVVLMVLSLGAVQPFSRVPLMADIHRGLNDAGCLLLVEWMSDRDSLFNNLFANYCVERRRRSGFNARLAERRVCVDDLLVPYSLAENRELLNRAGFRSVEVFFKWYGMCGMIAVK
jgi:tRNA (cmo5U34)-methyltransferase